MLKHSDGRVAHLETEYNDLFIDKHGPLLGLSSRYKGRPDYIDSIIDLKDPDAMPVPYNRIMPVALAYPQEAKRILMIGLGAGSISTYLGRARAACISTVTKMPMISSCWMRFASSAFHSIC